MTKVEATPNPVLICPDCTRETGEWELVTICEQCNIYFEEGDEIFCGDILASAGEHFCSEKCRDKYNSIATDAKRLAKTPDKGGMR